MRASHWDLCGGNCRENWSCILKYRFSLLCLSNPITVPSKGVAFACISWCDPNEFSFGATLERADQQLQGKLLCCWRTEIMKMACVQETPTPPYLLYLYIFRKYLLQGMYFSPMKPCIYSKKPFLFQNSKAWKKKKATPMPIMQKVF